MRPSFSSPAFESVGGTPRNRGRSPRDAGRAGNFSRPARIARHLRLTVAAGLLATGCASLFPVGRPGHRIDARFATSYGCDAREVARRADSLASRLPGDRHYIPRAGWSVCTLMAHNGRPSRIEHGSAGRGSYQTWWYEITRYDHALVTIRREPGRPWTVISASGW